jgi:hypothetical protein
MNNCFRMGGKIAEIKRRRITESLTCRRTETGSLIGYFTLVEFLFHFKNFFFGRFKYGIKTANYRHGKYDIAILSPNIHITEAIIGYSPYEIDDLVVNCGVH